MYDLIVVGGGPAGLMAASTAAKDGLKVLLVERKKNITATPRTDGSIFYWKFILADEYLEPIMVDLGTGMPLQAAGPGSVDVKMQLRFLGPGCTVNYQGPILFYYNFIRFSPSGHRVYCIKDELWSFHFSRERMLSCLFEEVSRTSTEVITGVTALGAENTNDGVAVRLKAGEREWMVRGKRAIAADGMYSRIVDSLGLNKDRSRKRVGVIGYILEGVEPEIHDHGPLLSFDIPSISPEVIYCCFHTEAGTLNLRHLVGFSAEALQKFMKESRYSSWFRHARLIRTTAVGGTLYSPPLSNPACGNVLVIGDAVSAESFIQGAIACGYQGAKATLKEMSGDKGYAFYTEWLNRSFSFYKNGEHLRSKAYAHIFPLARPSDDDVDYLFNMLATRNYVGHPAIYIARNPQLIEKDRPDFYLRLKAAVEQVNTMFKARDG